LVGLFGVEDLPVVGCAPGETMFAEFLRAHDLAPKLKSTVRLVLIPLGDAEVLRIADRLRENSVNVATDFTERKLDKKIRAAVKAGAEFVLFVGEDEIAHERYNLKNLATNQQDALTIDEIVALFAR
jgi:histidyl-tRNA synthetase